jgi:hypothetical protein
VQSDLHLQVDTSAPTVSSISATSDNGATDVTTGHVVTIEVSASEAVFVTGTPTLQLNDNEVATYTDGSGPNTLTFSYTVRSGDSTSDLMVTGLNLSGAAVTDGAGNALSASVQGDLHFQINVIQTNVVQTIQNDYLGIMRTALSLADATTEANAINAGTTTETQYVNGLLPQVADTTIPAVAVEASMYGTVGSSAEVTKLVTQYLPAQVANAIANGLNAQVYAGEVLGLAFAFGNENGGMAFANNFGPSNAAMPATATGDTAFAAAAASTIFGPAETANTPGAILTFVSNWEAFYTKNGIPGIANPTTAQIDLAARGAAWGDAVGIALANHLGPLVGQTTNFLEDAAQGTAIYSASLASQPNHAPFQGAATASVVTAASLVHVTGIAAPIDHIVT